MEYIKAVDKVVITVVSENHVDMLIPDTSSVKRVSMHDHFRPGSKPILSENGVAYLVDVFNGGKKQTILFDAGLTAEVLLHNFDVLERDINEIEHIVISHGHPDHYGGLIGILKKMNHPVPVLIHPDAFYPRYVKSATGGVIPYYNYSLNQKEIEEAGGRLVVCTEPLDVAPGIITTGEIPKAVEFEPPMAEEGKGANLYFVKNNQLILDMTLDDTAIAINVKNKGLIVITGCAHAGVISSIKRAQEVTSISDVYGVIGGFHLGFPGIPQENVKKTIETLKEIGVKLVSPNHCSGLNCQAVTLMEMPENFIQTTVGMRLTIDSES